MSARGVDAKVIPVCYCRWRVYHLLVNMSHAHISISFIYLPGRVVWFSHSELILVF